MLLTKIKLEDFFVGTKWTPESPHKILKKQQIYWSSWTITKGLLSSIQIRHPYCASHGVPIYRTSYPTYPMSSSSTPSAALSWPTWQPSWQTNWTNKQGGALLWWVFPLCLWEILSFPQIKSSFQEHAEKPSDRVSGVQLIQHLQLIQSMKNSNPGVSWS